MSKHTVEQGDFISRLAEKYGFANHETIWNDAANSQLKALRETPNVLNPGDVVQIPEKQIKTVTCQTTLVHIFKVLVDRLELRIVFKNYVYDPIASTDCTISVDGKAEKKQTNAEGLVTTEISRSAKIAELSINNQTQQAFIGHLNPVTEPSGQIARLNNLGYQAGPIKDPVEEMVRSAIEEFQCDHKPLKVDGVCGKLTQAELKKVHGS
jgi:hypothetical protein